MFGIGRALKRAGGNLLLGGVGGALGLGSKLLSPNVAGGEGAAGAATYELVTPGSRSGRRSRGRGGTVPTSTGSTGAGTRAMSPARFERSGGGGRDR